MNSGLRIGDEVLISATVDEIRSNGTVIVKTVTGDHFGPGFASLTRRRDYDQKIIEGIAVDEPGRVRRPAVVMWRPFDLADRATWPEEDGRYLFCSEMGTVHLGRFCWESASGDHWKFYDGRTVTAWAYLPKPFKEGGAE